MSNLVEISENNDLITGYSCATLVEQNEHLGEVDLEFYYDLTWLKDMEYAEAKATMESLLVREVASKFSINDGTICINPPEEGIWLIEIQSDPPDEVSAYDGCKLLEKDEERDCEGIKGRMSGKAVGAFELDDVVKVIADGITSGSVTAGTGLRAAYLGTEIDSGAVAQGKDNIAPAINDFSYEIPEEKNDFTALGGLLTAGIVLAFVGLLFVVWNRRRRSRVDERDLEFEENAKLGENGVSGATPVSTAEDDRKFKRAFKEEIMSDGTPAPEDFDERYTFDIGETLRNNLMNVHGQGQEVSVRSFRRMGVEIDSDMESAEDSWAQTDATLGSLETRLDPVTAEV